MAKKSSKARNHKRIKLAKKYSQKRIEFKEQARKEYVNGQIPWDVQRKLQNLPRNSSPSRIRRRCKLCGRAHAVYKKYGLCRLCLRKYTMQGYVPGLRKASW